MVFEELTLSDSSNMLVKLYFQEQIIIILTFEPHSLTSSDIDIFNIIVIIF